MFTHDDNPQNGATWSADSVYRAGRHFLDETALEQAQTDENALAFTIIIWRSFVDGYAYLKAHDVAALDQVFLDHESNIMAMVNPGATQFTGARTINDLVNHNEATLMAVANAFDRLRFSNTDTSLKGMFELPSRVVPDTFVRELGSALGYSQQTMNQLRSGVQVVADLRRRHRIG